MTWSIHQHCRICSFLHARPSRQADCCLEDKMVEITSEEQNKVKKKKKEKYWGQSQRPLGQYQRHQHSKYRVPRRRREKERVWENFWRDYSWKFPQHGKGNSQSVQEAQRVPYRINPRRNMPRHILIKLTKTKHKERILKASREKQQVTYKGNAIWSFSRSADLSAETLQAKRKWQDII